MTDALRHIIKIAILFRQAVRMLWLPHLEQDYEDAWREWEAAGDQAAWSVTAADGTASESR